MEFAAFEPSPSARRGASPHRLPSPSARRGVASRRAQGKSEGGPHPRARASPLEPKTHESGEEEAESRGKGRRRNTH